jgi:hypothetical protein
VARRRLVSDVSFLTLPELVTRLQQTAARQWIARKLMLRSVLHLRYEF